MDFSNTPIMELAVIVANHLSKHDIAICQVGGLAVEYYSDNLYQTLDIDLVNINYHEPKTIHAAMLAIGYTKKGKVFTNC